MPTSNSFCKPTETGSWAFMRDIAAEIRWLGWPMIYTSIAIFVLTGAILKAFHLVLKYSGCFSVVHHGLSWLSAFRWTNAVIWICVVFLLSVTRDIAVMYAIFLRHQRQRLVSRENFRFVLSRVPSGLCLQLVGALVSWSGILIFGLIFYYFEYFSALGLIVSLEVAVAFLTAGLVTAVRWALAMPLMVIEMIDWRSSLKRSWMLTLRFWVPLAVWVMISFSMYIVPDGIHEWPASSFGDDAIEPIRERLRTSSFNLREIFANSAERYEGLLNLQWWISGTITLIDNIVISVFAMRIMNVRNPINREKKY